MPYDPNFPPDHQPLNAAPFREQFQGLKEQIDDKVPLGDLDGYMEGFCAGKVPPDFPLLNLTVSNPPTQLQMQTVVNRFDALVDFLKRT
jgi:hypothetical protein